MSPEQAGGRHPREVSPRSQVTLNVGLQKQCPKLGSGEMAQWAVGP